mmetsp:Transcript_24548/g.53408  ORF Transcript_24548/g.53408 Transcript_24548/m.53408 type:complete len:791 (-) Transcript_24548:33-2405(-)
MYVPKRSGKDLAGVESADVDAKDFEDIEREQESAVFLRRPSNVARIEGATREYNFQAMKLLAAGNEDLLDRDIILHNLEVQQKRTWGLLSLPFSLIFFFAFAYSAFQHEDVTNRYVIESGLSTVLGEGTSEISTIGETWTWMNDVFFPKVFKQTDYRGEPLTDKSDWSHVLSYNALVGPVWIEQERSTKILCSDESDIAKDMYCYDAETSDISDFGVDVPFVISAPEDSNYAGGNVTLEEKIEFFQRPFKVSEETGASSRRLRIMLPTFQDRLSGGSLSAGIGKDITFSAAFYPNMPYDEIQERLNYMYQRQWIDKQTKHINFFATFLNVEMGRPRLQSFSLTLSFARSGDVFRKLRTDTIFLSFWSGATSMAADAAYFVLLMIVTVLEIRDIYKLQQKRKLSSYIRTGWFLLQWVTILVGWGIILMYQYLNLALGSLQDDLDALVDAQSADIPAETNLLGGSFIDNTSTWAYNATYLAIVVAQFHLLLMMRFFVAFRAQPRLGVVVNTLEACMLDILHFLVILFPSGIAYAISGCFVFGKRLEEFSDIKSAIGYCFKILVETEYDWPELSEEHYWTTGLWVWSFMVFLAMLMLNMVLAIVLDVYSEQRKSAGKSESITETIMSIWTIFRNRERWLGTRKIMDVMKDAPRMLTKTEFLELFPTMLEKQSSIIIESCQLTAQNIHAGPEQMKHTMRMAMALKVAMDDVGEAVDQLDGGTYQNQENLSQLSDEHWAYQIQKELTMQNHDMMNLQWQLQQLNWQWQAMELAHGKGAVFNMNGEEMKKEPLKVL